jgi:hypothetical protein
LIAFGEIVLYNALQNMRSIIFLKECNINDAPTTPTVKVDRDYPDKVTVRACLLVIWVDRGQAKMRAAFFAWPFYFFSLQPAPVKPT